MLPMREASASTLLLASIIAGQLDPETWIPNAHADNLVTTRRLAELSLDGLFKTIWFLGRVLPTIRAGQTVYGRKRPTRDDAINIIHCAFDHLTSWPLSFIEALEEIATHKASTSTASYLERLFRSAHRYLISELDQPETAFLRAAYEQQVRQIWRSAGNRRTLRNFDRQMELDFDSRRC